MILGGMILGDHSSTCDGNQEEVCSLFNAYYNVSLVRSSAIVLTPANEKHKYLSFELP